MHLKRPVILIKNGTIINEGNRMVADILVKEGRIDKIGGFLSGNEAGKIIDAGGRYVLPGIIDDQVHFREPGLTYKADIFSESGAAVAGGVTSYMEMPNTIPQTLTQQLLAEKYRLGSEKSLANYSFYMGVSNDNFEEVMKTDPQNVCGLKIFMGSSTGNMLVDDEKVLEKVFAHSEMLIATHCEYEPRIRANAAIYKEKYGDDVPPRCHAEIRDEEACYLSSSYAVQLAQKHGTRLHVLHISTEKELALFSNELSLESKKITAEACIHHLWFDKEDYERLGNRIKWNPSVKEGRHKKAIWEALLDDRIDVVATDHAPHTLEEKSLSYWKAPSGGPLVQHSLMAMLEFYRKGKISLEDVVRKMCHAPAVLFGIKERGFIREGYKADLVIVDMQRPYIVSKENLLYKCEWSPFEGETFGASVTHTLVSGWLAYENGRLHDEVKGERLEFQKK